VKYQSSADPALRFVELLGSAIASGQAHVADPNGLPPNGYEAAWGWRRENHAWRGLGTKIGWIDQNGLYVDCDAGMRVVRSVAVAGEEITTTAAVMRRRLQERGLLRTTDTDTVRKTLTIRKRLEKVRREVLHLDADQVLQVESDDAGAWEEPGLTP